MDDRAAKLALARKKLKDHQEKKLGVVQRDDGDKHDVNPYPYNVNISESKNNEQVHFTSNNETISNELQHHVPEIENTGNLTSVVSDYSNRVEINDHKHAPEPNLNVTEILISNKRNLEVQVNDLQNKLSQLEESYTMITNDYKRCSLKINELENELQTINNKYLNATKEILAKDAQINELNLLKATLSEDNNNLGEQLEFTKTILSTKEAESDSLHSQLFNLQNQYDAIHLQLQQLTTGSANCTQSNNVADNEKYTGMLQKITYLEQQLNHSQKERDQINLHYEHYVAELNEQLKSVIKKNEGLTKEVQHLSDRENSLIDQIGDMEIRIQNYNLHKKEYHNETVNDNTLKELEDDFKRVQDELNKLQIKHEQLQNQYADSVSKLKELSEEKETCNHDSISLSKLNADMASDKVAAQRATEQNKKLKEDLQRLEDAFVKMSKDKLELTEKLTAEKYLNRELTIKLAEIDEKSKEMQIKLKAKDEEMIRLQTNCREMEKQCEKISHTETNGSSAPHDTVENNCENHNDHTHCHNHNSDKNVIINDKNSTDASDDKIRLQKEDAMLKLQERFFKIMGDVADLSDEKHRLEHIILQLQTETDTICEYVALYQQQRSLLKRRDEERSAQLKVFQQECGKLKCEIEELSGIIARIAEDKELLPYFQAESRRADLEKITNLLSNLKNNSLIDPKKKDLEFKNFYPCNCCSGKLIDV